MTSLKERKARVERFAGDLANVNVFWQRNVSGLLYRIGCRECRTAKASSYRSGHENDFYSAVNRWVLHLDKAHPGVDAPCMKRLETARQWAIDQKMATQELLASIERKLEGSTAEARAKFAASQCHDAWHQDSTNERYYRETVESPFGPEYRYVQKVYGCPSCEWTTRTVELWTGDRRVS